MISRMMRVLDEDGFSVEIHPTETARSSFEGYSVFAMEPANAERSVTIREAYHPSFYRIEVEKKRWLWDVAKRRFDADSVDSARAQKFYRYWQGHLFGQAPDHTMRDGSVLIPLQGKLTRQRNFQACSPVEMIAQTAAHFPDRKMHVTLHPREVYKESELQALRDLQTEYPNVDLSQTKSFELLQRCDFVVTQNSSVAFLANFFAKPSVLFGKIDFHHIALDATEGDAAGAFAQVETHNPDYAAYIWWFWQKHAINLRKANADNRIRARLRKFGWPL